MRLMNKGPPRGRRSGPETNRSIAFRACRPQAIDINGGEVVFIRYDGAPQGAGSTKYVDKPQNVFSASDSAELITIDVCVQRIIHRSPFGNWHALSIAHSEFPTAAGDIFFAVEKGDRLRLTGRPSQYRNKPQLVIIRAERVPRHLVIRAMSFSPAMALQKNDYALFAKLMGMILRNVSLPSLEKLINCLRASVTPVETKFLRPADTLLP